MRSKILVYIPSVFFIHESKKYPFKQIKELGFDQLVLDSSHVVNEKNIKELLTKANLNLFGVYFDQPLSHQNTILLMETLHALDCSYLLINNLLEDDSRNIFEESGLKLLLKSGNTFQKTNINFSVEPVVIENPLSYQEVPLQSSTICESKNEKDTLVKGIESNLYFLINPDPKLEKTKYLMHCKDILNRYYFLGLR